MTDLSNQSKCTFTITEPRNYVMLNMKLFAEFNEVTSPHRQCEADDTCTVLFAADGDHFSQLATAALPKYASFNMNGISHLNCVIKYEFNITNYEVKCVF